MNKNNDHLENLKEIRSIMERSASFLSLSGIAGISAGIIGILGFLIIHIYLGKILIFTNLYSDNVVSNIKFASPSFLLYTAIIVLISAISSSIFFTLHKAKKQSLPTWDIAAKKLVLSLSIPLVTGGILCAIFIYYNAHFFVIPSMLIFFGLGLVNAGKYTIHNIEMLGLLEIFLGLTSFFFVDYMSIFWVLGFGVSLIIYGIIMHFKYE